MHIREVRVDDDDEFRAFYRTWRDAALKGRRQGMPMWSEHECAVMFRHPEPSEVWTAYGAFRSDVMVGAGLTLLTLLDNTDKALVSVAVAPPYQGRGVGTALVDHVTAVSADAGRTTLLAEANIPVDQREDHPYRRFAERQGFALANVEVRRMLALPVPTGDLDAWEAQAAPHHRGYRIETFIDDLPEGLIASYCYLQNQVVVDAPTGDIDFEPQAMTPEDFRARQEKLSEQGRTVYWTLATDAAGEAVAYTEMVIPSGDPGNVYQWSTLVRRDHRGHRLGLAVKARNLRVLQTQHPDRNRVITCNSEDNGPMVDINVLMGFEPVELLAEFQRRLD